MATQTTPFLTVEEYLKQEELSTERHEYLNGEIFAMAGGTPVHSQVGSNLLAELVIALRESDCIVRNGDMRLRAAPEGLYSYADVVVSCKDEQFERNTLLNPVVICEVLSKSTEDYDRGLKFEEYRKIASFREYLVVAQNRPYVEHHVREEVGNAVSWRMQEYTDMHDVLTLSSIGAQIALAGIYRKVAFEQRKIG